MRVNGGKEHNTENKEKGNQSNSRRAGPGDSSRASLAVIGIGPGLPEYVSPRAKQLIHAADVIVGYKTYLELIKELTEGKEIHAYGMRQEVDRGKHAIEEAVSGRKVCIISGGDPGVYALASLVLELLPDSCFGKVDIEIVPGITAATSAAAVLGAPLTHDFACISLSDLLTDRELIKNRIKKAAEADFVIVLYNPKSHSRTTLFDEALEIIGEFRKEDTPVGIVQNGHREGQKMAVTTLRDASSIEWVDMRSVVIVGNSQTYTRRGWMVTPRGYV